MREFAENERLRRRDCGSTPRAAVRFGTVSALVIYASKKALALARRLDSFFGNDEHLGNINQLAALFAHELLQPPKGILFVEGSALHENSLGPLDDLAVLQGLAQIGCFAAQRLELLEAPHGQRNCRSEIGLFDRLDEISQDVIAFGACDRKRE
jgi:hypothetical protein